MPFPQNMFSFPAKAPATEIIESLGVAIHGQSSASQATTSDLAADYPLSLDVVVLTKKMSEHNKRFLVSIGYSVAINK